MWIFIFIPPFQKTLGADQILPDYFTSKNKKPCLIVMGRAFIAAAVFPY